MVTPPSNFGVVLLIGECFSRKAEILISSDDEEDQQPPSPKSATAVPGQVYAATDTEFGEQMNLMLRRSIVHINGLAPPPGTLLPMKPEPASPPSSAAAQPRHPNRMSC